MIGDFRAFSFLSLKALTFSGTNIVASNSVSFFRVFSAWVTARAWFPVEAVVKFFFVRLVSLANAPRSLNEPVSWSHSHFR